MSKDIRYRRLVGSKRWARLALELKARANWQCSLCGIVTKRLAVHHILPVEGARTEEEMEARCFDKNNLQVLCYECHSKIHYRSRGKSGHMTAQDARVERFIAKDLHIDENLPRL